MPHPIIPTPFSSIPPEKRNSMRIHQILNEGSERLEGVSMFEQGAGQFDLLTSFVALQSYTPQITYMSAYLSTYQLLSFLDFLHRIWTLQTVLICGRIALNLYSSVLCLLSLTSPYTTDLT